MSATKCLKCDESVLIPSGASLKATVRCPLCHEEFVLGDLLEEIPPPLEIVEDPDAVAIADVEHFSFDPDAKKDDESADTDSYEVAADKTEGDESDDEAESSAPAFHFDAGSQDSSDTATKSYRPSARPKRKAKNPAVEIGKVVGGGVLGIAIALVAIWWGPKLFGKPPKDILDIGTKVSKVAPWLVPAELHALPADEKDDDDPGEDQKKEGNSKPRPDQGTPLPRSDKRNDQIGRQDLSPKFNPDGTVRENGNGDTPKPRKDKTKKNDDPPAAKPIDRSASDFLGIRNVETSTTEELEQALSSAAVTLTLWDSDLESEKYRQNALEALTRLGKSIACVNQTTSANRDLIRETEALLKDLAEKGMKLDVVNAWAAEQLKQSGSEPQGVVFAAEVKAIEETAALFENRLELLTEGKEQISMLTGLDITSHAPPGTKVIVIGAIVEKPAENFGGYLGNDDKVLGCGTLVVLAPLTTNATTN